MRLREDLLCSVILITLVLVYAATAGNTLYLGYWYLVGLPVAMLVPGLILRARALFLSGTTAAAMVTLLIYMAIIPGLGREAGLIGLGHLLSAPGMFVGATATAWLLRFRVNASLPWIVAGVAFLGAGLGFMIAQVIVCNTVMFCGAVSFGGWR